MLDKFIAKLLKKGVPPEKIETALRDLESEGMPKSMVEEKVAILHGMKVDIGVTPSVDNRGNVGVAASVGVTFGEEVSPPTRRDPKTTATGKKG